eukprot:6186457-Pleurochrysis_carterae.AAC.2
MFFNARAPPSSAVTAKHATVVHSIRTQATDDDFHCCTVHLAFTYEMCLRRGLLIGARQSGAEETFVAAWQATLLRARWRPNSARIGFATSWRSRNIATSAVCLLRMAVIGYSCLLMGLCCLTFRAQAAFLGLARPSEMLRRSQGMKSVVFKSLSHATNAGHCDARSSASVPCRMQLQCVPTGKAVQNLFGAAQPATRRLSVSGRTRFQARSREISRVTSLQMHTAPVTPRDAQLVLAYARPLRKLMKSTQDAKEAVRSETVSVNTESALADLRKTLRLRFAFLADDDLDALILEHGRRRVTSDDDLARLIAEARRHEIAPVLRVIPSPHSSIAQASNRSKLAEKQARARAATPPSGPQQLLSFFSFRAKPFDDAELSGLESDLRQSLAALGVLGTIYLAPEGLNAQLSVPLSQLPQLRAQIASSEHLADVELNLGMQV